MWKILQALGPLNMNNENLNKVGNLWRMGRCVDAENTGVAVGVIIRGGAVHPVVPVQHVSV